MSPQSVVLRRQAVEAALNSLLECFEFDSSEGDFACGQKLALKVLPSILLTGNKRHLVVSVLPRQGVEVEDGALASLRFQLVRKSSGGGEVEEVQLTDGSGQAIFRWKDGNARYSLCLERVAASATVSATRSVERPVAESRLSWLKQWPDAVRHDLRGHYRDLLENTYRRPGLRVLGLVALLSLAVVGGHYLARNRSPDRQLLALLYPPAPVHRGSFSAEEGALALNVYVHPRRSPQAVPLAERASISSNDAYYVEILLRKSGYLYVFQADETDQVTWLFPTNTWFGMNSYGQNPVRSETRLRIPPQPERLLVVSGKPGVETIFAVLSSKPWPALTNLLARTATGSVKDQEVTARGLGGLAPEDSIHPANLESANHAIVRTTFRREPGLQQRGLDEALRHDIAQDFGIPSSERLFVGNLHPATKALKPASTEATP